MCTRGCSTTTWTRSPTGSARRQQRLCPLCAPQTTQAAPHRENGLVIGVELRGLEPLTPTLPVWCATSCATAPCLDPVWCVRAGTNCTGPRRRLRVGGRDGSALRQLRDPQVVAEGVTETEVGAVRLVDRLLGDLDPLGPELRVGLVGVVAAEEEVATRRSEERRVGK